MGLSYALMVQRLAELGKVVIMIPILQNTQDFTVLDPYGRLSLQTRFGPGNLHIPNYI